MSIAQNAPPAPAQPPRGPAPPAPGTGAGAAGPLGPLYVFDLPRHIVPYLGVRTLDDVRAPTSDDAPSDTHTQASAGAGAPKALTRCTICPQDAPFSTPAARRAHFRTDWHRYNLAARQRRAPTIPEAEFERLYAQVEADASDSDASEGETDALEVLLGRLDVGEQEHDTRTLDATLSALRSPIVWFESRPDAPPDARLAQTQLGVLRDMLPDDTPLDGALGALQLEHVTRRPDKHVWTGTVSYTHLTLPTNREV